VTPHYEVIPQFEILCRDTMNDKRCILT